MGLLTSTLKAMKGDLVVVVTSDARVFRGHLADCDDEVLILEDAVEGNITNTDAWSEVTIGDAVAHRVATPRGPVTVFQRPGGAHQWRLTRVLILVPSVHRVWTVGEAREQAKGASAGGAPSHPSTGTHGPAGGTRLHHP